MINFTVFDQLNFTCWAPMLILGSIDVMENLAEWKQCRTSVPEQDQCAPKVLLSVLYG